MLLPPGPHVDARVRPRHLLAGILMQGSIVIVLILGLGTALVSCERSGEASDQREAASGPGGERAGIALPGDCRGAWWDGKERSLYLTDVTHDALIRWREGGGFETVATLPPASSLGGVVRIADGRFVISSFGFGQGAIHVVDLVARGAARTVGGIDPGRRRTGLALAPDGAVYVAYFEVARGGVPRGGVSRLELRREDGGEIDVAAPDLRKPMGLAATDAALYVTDQHRAALYVIPRGGGAPGAASAADLPEPELVTALPGGELIVVSRDGVVFRVPARGPAVQLARGQGDVRALAYDAERARLFLVEQHAAEPRHRLHILPVVR